MVRKERAEERRVGIGGSEMNEEPEIVTRGKWVGASSKKNRG